MTQTINTTPSSIKEGRLSHTIISTLTRLIVISWILLCAMMRLDDVAQFVVRNWYLVLAVTLAATITLTYFRWDTKLFNKYAPDQRFVIAVTTLLAAWWIQIGLEGIYMASEFTSAEPFIYYETNFIVMGLPGSILVMLLLIVTSATLPEVSLVIDAAITWALYAVGFAIQYKYIVHIATAKSIVKSIE